MWEIRWVSTILTETARFYEALVVMSQDFKKGQTLVDGHGNFGSIEGDGAAAMRYTEARLERITQDVYLADLDKDVVDFGPNFDETEKGAAGTLRCACQIFWSMGRMVSQ